MLSVVTVYTTVPTGAVSAGDSVSTNLGLGQLSALTFTVRSLQVLLPRLSTAHTGTYKNILTITAKARYIEYNNIKYCITK